MAQVTSQKFTAECEKNGISKESNGCVSYFIDSLLWFKYGRCRSKYSGMWRRNPIKL